MSDLLGPEVEFRTKAELAHAEYEARETAPITSAQPPVIVADSNGDDPVPWYRRWFAKRFKIGQ